jgi:hypothetical protein
MISSELCWDLGDRPIDSEDDDIFSLSQHTAYISRRSSVTTKLTAYVAANIKRSVSVLSVLKSMVGICLSVGVMGCSAYYFKQHGELCLVALAWRAGASWRAVCVESHSY